MSGVPPATGARPSLVESLFRVQELADYIVPFAIRVVCELRVADHLIAGPRPVAELAGATGVHAPSLYRVLRALACKGIFAEVAPGQFGLTPLAELLRGDHPLSLREAYPLLAPDIRAWAEFAETVRTGRSAFEHVFGQGYYEYLAANPHERARVDGSVLAQNRHVLRTVLHAYPWAQLGPVVVDVGGGTGAFLAGLLARFKQLRGVLQDLPQVVAAAPAVLAAAGVADRCEMVAGSFFEHVPHGHDSYLLKTILHDWSDERALRLLRVVRGAMRPDSRLVVLEPVLPAGDAPHLGKLLDLHSLVLVAGPDRNLAELSGLFAAADLSLRDTVGTETLAILNVVPV